MPFKLSLRAAAIDHAKQGGLRIDIKHKYYVPFLANLLVIYIIRMKTRPRRAPYSILPFYPLQKWTRQAPTQALPRALNQLVNLH